MMPLPPPPVPAGGTLVSSATQAGNPPPPVTAGPHFAGVGYEGPFGPVTPPGGYGFAPPVPLGTYPQGTPGGNAQGQFPTGAQQGAQIQPAPGSAGHGADDTTDQVVRASARPTLIVRRPRSSRLPLAVLAVVGAAGAVVGVWLAIRSDASTEPAASAPPSTVPGAASPSEPAEATKPGATATADPAAAAADPTKADDRADGAAPAAGAAKGPADPAPGSTKVASPGEPAAQPGTGADAPGDAKDPKKRPARPVPQDVRAKPPRPKVRSEVKRPEPKRPDSKRGQKPEAKEPSWNADSPFLPEATPKR